MQVDYTLWPSGRTCCNGGAKHLLLVMPLNSLSSTGGWVALPCSVAWVASTSHCRKRCVCVLEERSLVYNVYSMAWWDVTRSMHELPSWALISERGNLLTPCISPMTCKITLNAGLLPALRKHSQSWVKCKQLLETGSAQDKETLGPDG